ncbi:branched-chain amino acid aminotransferase [Klugiella xanthotipulae]|uniref:Branched-chain-amino-acid aminotransferase n=1 Tax=Klugiella xanthotipulae TaxID=244735 RepID=A0A543I470_9MICO|nr:branched-chain amino acid aminotransferase [Klugiella xanthotipulae]TQM65392.1 branched chain amino acid aminotransferase [Klugiella xanthotipulae]
MTHAPITTPLTFTTERNTHSLPAAEREAILADPGFGKYFTDHMVSIDWSRQEGWTNARVLPYGPLLMDPASSVLHYGQEIFEGMKVYRHPDDSLWTFRPEANGTRLNLSAQRLALPQLPVGDFIESLRQLIAVDGPWVPSGHDMSLYLRPFMIANESFLGVRAAEKVSYLVIASPAGPYFASGVKPVSIWLSTEYSRAGRGGTGAAKCGGNYASSLLPQQEAAANGCQQVLFLDAVTREYIDELGGMNVFFVKKDGTLLTPNLNGNILHGVTRASIIQLAKDRGVAVEERPITITEWKDGVASGDIVETFACGTAAVITPINVLKGPGFEVGDPEAPAGEFTMSIREELTDIHHGRRPDRHGWLTRLDA